MKNKYLKYLKIYDKPDNIIIENEKGLFIGERLDNETVAVHIVTTAKRYRTITEEDLEDKLKLLKTRFKFALAPIKPQNIDAINLVQSIGFKHLTDGDEMYHIYGREL